MDDYKERAQQRSMKMVAERDVFVATFEDCLFEQNSSGKNNDVTTNHGVISLVTPSNRLIVKDSVFHGNYFGDEDITVSGHFHCIESSPLTIVLFSVYSLLLIALMQSRWQK